MRNEAPLSRLHRALVIATGRNSAWIAVDGESTPRIAQLRRASGKRSMPVPGDVVHVRILEDDRTVVDRIDARAFTLERRSVDGRAKTMAANVDMLVTVTALANPPPRTITLDQLLAFAELEEIGSAVVFTKPDMADPGETLRFVETYGALGYPVLVLNPKSGAGVEALRELIAGHHALLSGVSGVGKSTIFRALGGEGATGDVSRHGLGRQTTTTARLYRMGEGFLIDSPGVNEFGLGTIGPAELAEAFREMRPLVPGCRFTDCSHRAEPGCAVKLAVEQGRMAPSRYASYLKMLESPT
ncbi:MAG: ribosome small subunit-dependent GTPase A [Candidatus Eremiobacteraeota bacterium]|nr:ribosome small subunit-dependent GTPase A [Candidatus Eremiobacteraeota bacterium]